MSDIDTRRAIEQWQHAQMAETAAGPGAGGYYEWAKARGYVFIEPLDTTSSMAEWAFRVSKDGEQWDTLYQHHDLWHGFSYELEPGEQ